ncbi:hypothetical protein KGF57_002109 [Candida theae]|uniref:Uncharacterized protein n=1 Tax=Candida theae TaxID=1198502 RepID=A0AAD5FZ97_9ASCO|nr:uncharacterized protein KGF57_002109 [Candida theae]KAI5959333.1 hypothetical protein KGF57_002109 [Candida theae]
MLFRRKSKDSLQSREPSVSIRKSRSARDLLSRLTTTPSQSKKSLDKHDKRTSQPELHLDTDRQYLPYEEPFTILTPKEDEFKNCDLMTPIRQMTATPETMQAPQQHSSQTHSGSRAKVLSTIIDFENESIVEMYTPRKAVNIQNHIRLNSACAVLEKISWGDDKEIGEQDGIGEGDVSATTNDDDDLTFDGAFSTSTSCQNSPNKDPFDTVSLTEANIQIYKRSHRKSKHHDSLHFVQGILESPTRPQKVQDIPTITPPPSLQAGLAEEEQDSRNSELYQLEIMLLQEKHKYEMKQQQRALDDLQSQLKQQRNENTLLRNQIAQLEHEAYLLPAFKWDKPGKSNSDERSHKVTFKDNDDAGSFISTEESIMSLYYDERKVSGASTVGSSSNSVNKKFD